jgi:protease PrsW
VISFETTVDQRIPKRSILSGSLRAHRGWAIVLIGVLVAVFIAGLVQLVGPAIESSDVAGVALSGYFLALGVAVPCVVLVAYLDRREREPWWLATLAYLWGAVVATGLALALNATVTGSVAKLFDETTAIADTTALGIQVVDPAGLFVWLETGLVAPLLEEAVKGIALVMLFMLLPTEANSMRDGIVYGALVGLGFAVMETTVYITTEYAATGVAPYISQIVPRFALFGVSGHALYSAMFGAGLGMARQSLTYGRVRRFLVPFSAFLLAVSAHAMSNVFGPYAFAAAASLTGTATDGMVSVGQLWVLSLVEIVSVNLWALVIIIYMGVRSGYWELDVAKTELRDEVPGAVSLEEYRLVEAEGLWRLRRIGGVSSRWSARLVRAQNELAFRRHDVRRAGGDPDEDALIEQRRAQVASIRARMATSGG